MNALRLHYETSMGTATVMGFTEAHIFIKVSDQYVVGSFPAIESNGSLSWHWGHYFPFYNIDAEKKAKKLFTEMVQEEIQ